MLADVEPGCDVSRCLTLVAQLGEGELVSYRSVRDASGFYLVTGRRVTEAELRLDVERVRLGVDPAAMAGAVPRRSRATRAAAITSPW